MTSYSEQQNGLPDIDAIHTVLYFLGQCCFEKKNRQLLLTNDGLPSKQSSGHLFFFLQD